MKKIISIALLFLTIPAFAQQRGARETNNFASDNQTIPVMANTVGFGNTAFFTNVALLNPTSAPMTIDVTLFDAAGAKRMANITLAAGEQKTYVNFLAEVFNFTGGGAVTMKTPAGQRFIVDTVVRTGGARYTTSVPALEFAGSASRSFAPGITVDQNTRTNVGCFNQSDATNVITATVFDNSGHQTVGTTTLTLGPNAWGQTALNTIVIGGYVQFDPQEAAVCYAVVVDNTTNDGRFISAAEFRP